VPDAYGRGRIIGDYRRVALYGVDRLIERKQEEKASLDSAMSTDEIIRDREELAEQIRALGELKQMAEAYGFDISRPAATAKEAVQWLYFAYLAGIKEQNGAAMSLGRTSTFLDIYIERDLAEKVITESEAQELIDQLVIKLRIVRFMRTPEYDALFSGKKSLATVIAESDRRIDPVFDDSPFYFAIERPWGVPYYMRIALAALVWPVLGLLAVFVAFGKPRGEAVVPYAKSVVYFACLGAGFIAIELSLLQHLTLLLGHPIFTLSILLCTILAAGGIGSALSNRVPRRAACVAVAALGGVVAPAASATDPDCTRTSLVPRRMPVR